MRRRDTLRVRAAAFLVGAAGLVAVSPVVAWPDAGATAPPALPPGHPPMGADPSGAAARGTDGDLPPGHPGVGPGARPMEADHGGASSDLPPGHPVVPGRARAGAGAEDRSFVDAELPAGTVLVEVADADERPVPGAAVTIGILQQSVQKGESRRRVQAKTDATGGTRFDGLEASSGTAYRASVAGPGGPTATYAAAPFALDHLHGQRVRIHVYPATTSADETGLAVQVMVYLELRDDVIQVEQMLRFANLGRTTWVPANVVLRLPAGFKAFTSPQQMGDVGLDPVESTGARLRGTFGPGFHEATFRYQVPYAGEERVDVSIGLPPRVAAVQIAAEAGAGAVLEAAGFPAAQPGENTHGQHILITERQTRRGGSPTTSLDVTLRNLPGPGSGRYWATTLSIVVGLWGIAYAWQQRGRRAGGAAAGPAGDEDAIRARDRLIDEIAAVEHAHASGEIGPTTYATARRALVDALARLLHGHPSGRK